MSSEAGTMKSGKDEEKVMGPMFPRLHVNDTEKGGPRAPPRNKMALYEQISIPSQKSVSRGKGMLRPTNNTNPVVAPSASPIQEISRERSMLPSFYMPSAGPPYLDEKLHSFSEISSKFSDIGTNNEINTGDTTKNTMEKLNADSISFHRQDRIATEYSEKNPGGTFAEKDDFCVPAFIHSRLPQQGPNDEREQCSVSHQADGSVLANCPKVDAGTIYCSSFHLPETNDARPGENKTDLKIQHKQHRRNLFEERSTETNIMEGSVELLPQSCEERAAKSLCSLNHDSLGASEDESMNTSKSGLLYQEENCDNDKTLGVGSETGSRTSHEDSRRSSDEGGQFSIRRGCESHGSQQMGHEDHIDDSESSMVDSVSILAISPDDVVGVIGQSQFWKARKAIANQQRVFAIQVFELHRLIKVQKLIAASPHLLFEDQQSMNTQGKDSPETLLPSESFLKSQSSENSCKDDDHQPNNTACGPPNNPVSNPTHHADVESANGGLANHNIGADPYFANTTDIRSPWHHPMLGYQWLVPVTSPSEGLIYKPYLGPCPPAGSFMVPTYGGFGSTSLPPISGCFMGPTCGIPMSPQQQHLGLMPAPQPCFLPYGFPMMNPALSAAGFGQVNVIGGGWLPHAPVDHFSSGEVNWSVNSKMPSDAGSQNRDCITCREKNPNSKENAVHSSAARVFSENTLENGVTPLWNTTLNVSKQMPSVQGGDQQVRAIKAVPHNPRSANESAAKIFKSIQRGRRHHDSD